MNRRPIHLILLLFCLAAGACSGGHNSVFSRALSSALSQYDAICDVDNGFIHVEKSGKMGLISLDGKELTPCQFDTIGRFHWGIAIVRKNGRYGAINMKGKLVGKCNYDTIGECSEGLSMVGVDGLFGYMDCSGNVPIAIRYAAALPFSEGRAVVADGITYDFGCVDTHDSTLISFKHEGIGQFSEGLAAVEYAGHWGYIDRKGKLVIPYLFDSAEPFSEGRAKVRISREGHGLYGFIDHKGNTVVDCIYSDANSFSNGLAPVEFNSRWGYIDRNGRVVVDFNLNEALPYRLHYGRARKGTLWVTFDEKGQPVETHLRGGRHLVNNYGHYSVVEHRGRYGLCDTAGQMVIPCRYDTLIANTNELLDKELVIVRRKGHYALADLHGHTSF